MGRRKLIEGARKMSRPKKDRSGQPLARLPGGVVQRVQIGRTVYVQVYTRCGPGCTTCRRGAPDFDEMMPGHGPYWYAHWTSGGKLKRRYVGVNLAVRGVSAGEEVQDEAVAAAQATL